MGEIINPYIAGAPVTEQRMFFGREDIFQWIENSIAGQYADHILVLHGQRRVGKTSVLKQLSNRLPHRYIPVFFDLQGRTHTTLDHFLWWLAREIVRVLKQERAIEVPPPQKESFAADPEYFENQFLTSLQSHLGSATLLLTFDEFDNLEESEVREELARPLIDHLRRLMGHPNLNFIFSIGSSGRKLENMQAAYTDFFKTALYKKISFLSEEQTHHLVTRPVAGVIEYERPAVDRIYQIASGHPYFTQLTCHELFARCQRTEQRKIAVADVESVLDDVVERGTVNLKFVWDEASDIEKWSLAALVQLEKTDNRTLAEFLRRNHVRFSETDLTSGLLRLREKDVLTPQNRFVIHLLHIWLQKNRPIEQVREELTESNPIANRFIEIGLEFRDGGQPEKAIEFFRQALSVASDNLQAQVNIALTYAAQGHLEQAIAEFEKALTIDDEDVASRSGLCDAHLALGDAAVKRGRVKDAVLSYQRVLAINAEHLEARGRMAELSRQRAEKALADGRDEEALSAFAEALKFTPEDQALIARSEKVRAEKNAKVLADQISRSEKEAAARNWAKAVEALNAALEIAPGDASILKRIETINQSQLRERIDALLSKVAAAEKTERWDAAIGGLNEYLQLKPDDTAVQKRIADLVEARHTAWQKAVLERVDHAVADRNWDAALSALNEALRLEPDNTVMQARSGQVRAERRTAELNARLARAESAAGAGRWDEAIEVLNDGLAAEPENETLKTKLAEARKARRESRLQAALRLAESAAQAGKWETAAASLQEVLVNEPDNPEFIQKLAEIKALERESRLGGLETLAQSLLKAEKFDEALAAWNEYLALLPADREKAQAEIAAVKKAQTLASLYADAATAHASKNYEKAIELFKRIVAEDAEYKDTTDLLAEAVRLRRSGAKAPKIAFKKSWVIGGGLALLALGIGAAVFWFGKNGLFAAPAPVSTATRAAPTLTPPRTPDLRTLNPVNQHRYMYVKTEMNWHQARDYCASRGGHLATIQDASEDEFVYQLTSRTGETFLGATDEVEEGVWVWVTGEPWDYKNWDEGEPNNYGDQPENYLSYHYDVPAPQNSRWNDGGNDPGYFTCEWEPSEPTLDPAIQIALDSIQSEEPLYQTSFDIWDFGDLVENASIENGKLIVRGGENQSTYVNHSFFQSDRFAIQFEIQILESVQGGGCLLNIGTDGEYSMRNIFMPSGELEVDHLEMDGYEITIGNGQFDPSNVSTTTLIVLNEQISLFVDGKWAFTSHDPEGSAVYTNLTYEADSHMICGFDNFKFWDLRNMDSAFKSALATIQSEEPLYQTSFDSWESWSSHGTTKVENGKLIVASENQQHAGVDLYNLTSDKYAVQFDLRVLDISRDGHCIFETTNDAKSETSAWRAISAQFFSNGQATLARYIHPDRFEDFEGAVGEYDRAKSNTVTLIFLGDQIAAFTDGALIYTVLDPDESALFTHQALSANYTAQCEYDNFKIWDLSEVDSAVRVALAAIQSKEPLYQTSFDTWDFGYPVENARVENGKLIVNNDSDIHTYVPMGYFNFYSKRFAIEFETQLLESLDKAACSLNIDNNDTVFRVIFKPRGEFRVDRPKLPVDLVIGSGKFDPSISNNFMLIVLDDQFSIFINDEMEFTRLDPEGNTVYTSGLFEAHSLITCEFDNYKFWDLSGVNFNP